jgi:hypothetical protein
VQEEYRRLQVFVDNYDPAGHAMVDKIKDAGQERTLECIPPMALVDSRCIGDPSLEPLPAALRERCRVDRSAFECARFKQRVAERVREYKEALKRQMGLDGYTPYADEAAEHLRNSAVASKYERMARAAREIQNSELGNKILKEFEKWSKESRPNRNKAFREFGDGSVGPIGHEFAAMDKKHHEHSHKHHHPDEHSNQHHHPEHSHEHHQPGSMKEAAKKERARTRQSKAFNNYKVNQNFRVIPQRFPHEDGAGEYQCLLNEQIKASSSNCSSI